MKNPIRIFFVVLTVWLIILQSCTQQDTRTAQGDWIKGTEEEKIRTVEKHFRGFDNAMVETGYRYQELYWAGKDENWDYAKYQLEKIKVAIEYGLERRPKRAASAEIFLNDALPEMQEAIRKNDTAVFNKSFLLLNAACQNCHNKEKVPFVKPAIPVIRTSPVALQ